MSKPRMTPKAVLAGLNVPAGDSQRKAITTILDSEIVEATNEVAANCAAPECALRSSASVLAALMDFKGQLSHAYSEAGKMELSTKRRKGD